MSEKPAEMEAEEPEQNQDQKQSRRAITFLVILGVLILAYFVVRPGVFTIQPLGAFPEGITFIYHSRGPEVSVFSSPDGLCLEIQGSVNLLCRGMMIGAAEPLIDRIILRLPYQRWAYLLSTGGREFDG